MDTLLLSRWQFGITTVYHFFFVPLTLGLVWLLVYMQMRAHRTKNPEDRKQVKFWGKIFLINFAMGVATGIVQEFQFGMNWSGYSRFVGDIFGAPLAIEALLAFFLESTFLGVWIFGEGKISPRLHNFSIWMVAIGSTLSAYWILIANSFMHHPVGYQLVDGRLEMTDFWAVATNPHIFYQFPHVMMGGLCTAAFLMIGISSWQIYFRKKTNPWLYTSLRIGAIAGLAGTLLVMGSGHSQAQAMFRMQPMKMAAAEGLYETEDPAGFSIFSILNEKERKEEFSIRIPYLGSLLLHNSLSGEMTGMNQLQKQYEEKYGPGDYYPPVNVSFFAFRTMVGAGSVMLLLTSLLVFLLWKNRKQNTLPLPIWLARIAVASIALPYIANSAGWILTELGRQPWVVQGLLLTKNAFSTSVHPIEVAISLTIFTTLYGVLMAVTVALIRRAANNTEAVSQQEVY
jgi:cytochrome bd ubiquinol oxidase subunit I